LRWHARFFSLARPFFLDEVGLDSYVSFGLGWQFKMQAGRNCSFAAFKLTFSFTSYNI